MARAPAGPSPASLRIVANQIASARIRSASDAAAAAEAVEAVEAGVPADLAVRLADFEDRISALEP